MKVTVTSGNRSLTEWGVLYVRDVVHDVDDALGAKLIATGKFGDAPVPPKTEAETAQERETSLLDRIARLEALLIGADPPTTLAEAAEAAEPVAVTNAEPRIVARTDTETDEDLESMTKTQLRGLARSRGLKLPSKVRSKTDIIAALRG